MKGGGPQLTCNSKSSHWFFKKTLGSTILKDLKLLGKGYH